MAERSVNGYKRLFEVRLLHHYWLDEGGVVFDQIPDPLLPPDEAKKEKRLLTYDVRSFLTVTPAAKTTRVLNGLNCIYRNTALGFIVAVPASVVLPPQTTFDFVVTIQNAAFFNYTALTLRPQKIYELYHQAENRTYRYKENVPVLSNLTGASRGTGINKKLFLSREIPAIDTSDQVESLVRSGNVLSQLTGDYPPAPGIPQLQQLSDSANEFPVFVHQGDAPVIVPPAGLVGAPARGITLSDDIADEVAALIRLSPIRENDGDFSFVDGNGQAKTTGPVFQIRFKNRLTTWQYINKSTGALDITSPTTPLPLTYFGNPGTKQKPSEGLVKAMKSGNTITRLVSEIFV
jgi:hypothetical protein